MNRYDPPVKPYRAVWRDADGREHDMVLVPSARALVERIADRAADALFGAGQTGEMIVRPA